MVTIIIEAEKWQLDNAVSPGRRMPERKVVVFMKKSTAKCSSDNPLPRSRRIKITTEKESCYGNDTGRKNPAGN